MASLRKIKVQKERKMRKHMRKSKAKAEAQKIQEAERREQAKRKLGREALGFDILREKHKQVVKNERQRLQKVHETA